MTHDLKFGWLSPVIGNRWSDHQPIVVSQVENILPTATKYMDSVWIADHFYGFDAKTDPFMEAWTTLTWIAAKFDNVDLCHHVLGHGYRPPALTAKMAATLQVFAKNRFILGIGAGWRGDEYEAYGYDFPRPSVRFGQLDEVIDICRLMWTEDFPTYEGEYYQITEASAPPLPQVAPPICIGASGEQIGLPLVGRQADMWNSFVSGADATEKTENWKRKWGIVHEAASAAGREPSDIVQCTTIERALPETDQESEEFLELLSFTRDLGISYFVLDFGNPLSTEPIERFAEQVMAPLKAG